MRRTRVQRAKCTSMLGKYLVKMLQKIVEMDPPAPMMHHAQRLSITVTASLQVHVLASSKASQPMAMLESSCFAFQTAILMLSKSDKPDAACPAFAVNHGGVGCSAQEMASGILWASRWARMIRGGGRSWVGGCRMAEADLSPAHVRGWTRNWRSDYNHAAPFAGTCVLYGCRTLRISAC